MHQVLILFSAANQDIEILHPPVLPTRLQGRRPFGVGQGVVADINRGRRALEYVKLLRRCAEMGDALNGSRAGADDADPFVPEVRQIAVAVTTGVAIVPAAGVERIALERIDTRNAGQLRPAEWPIRHCHVLRLEPVATIGADDPAPLLLVPPHVGDGGL